MLHDRTSIAGASIPATSIGVSRRQLIGDVTAGVLLTTTFRFARASPPTPLLQRPSAAELEIVVLAANLPPSVGKFLRLTCHNVARIYDGRITRWDDPELVAANPRLRKVHEPIVPLHGPSIAPATMTLLAWLSPVSDAWGARAAAGDEADWPVGNYVRRSDLMARMIGGTGGRIGYMPWQVAHAWHLPLVASIDDGGGTFVSPGDPGYPIVPQSWKPQNPRSASQSGQKPAQPAGPATRGG